MCIIYDEVHFFQAMHPQIVMFKDEESKSRIKFQWFDSPSPRSE